MSQAATPAAIEGATRRGTALEVERRILLREAVAGADHAERIAALEPELGGIAGERAALEERWARERELVQAMQADRTALDALTAAVSGAPADAAAESSDADAPDADGPDSDAPDENVPDENAPDADALRASLNARRAELATLAGERPMVFDVVDAHAIARW